jgi:hypothetical protein
MHILERLEVFDADFFNDHADSEEGEFRRYAIETTFIQKRSLFA